MTPRTLAAAGILGPALFTTGVLVQQLLRSEYDPIAQPISDLTAGPYGWLQQVNFIVFGLLVIVFAAGLHHGVSTNRAGRIGPVILAINGIGLVLAGIFPLRQDAAGAVSDPLGVHTVNGIIFFLGIGIGVTALSLTLKRDPRWRGLSTHTLVTGVLLLALFVVLAGLARPPGAPLHDWRGLMQRLVLLVWLTCVITLAIRLRRITARTIVRYSTGVP